MKYSAKFARAVGVVAKAKSISVQGAADKVSYAPGGSGTLHVGLFLPKGKSAEGVTVSVKGPKGVEVESKSLDSVKGKQIVKLGFKTTKKVAKGTHQLSVTVRFTPKGKQPHELTFELPVVVR